MTVKRFVVAGLLCAVVAGCASAAKDPASVGKTECTPIDYRNGVYYFPCTEADFANALSAFKENHSDLQIVAMTGDGSGGYGHDQGYFLVAERR